MAEPEPHRTSEDDVLAKRMDEFFARASGRESSPPPAHRAPTSHPVSVSPGPTGATPPPPPGAPAAPRAPGASPAPAEPGAPGAPGARTTTAAAVLVAATKRLEALLERGLQESRTATQQMLEAIGKIDGRLSALEARQAEDDEGPAFRDELFEWLEGYSQWEANALNSLRSQIEELYHHLFDADSVPQPAPLPPTSTAPTTDRPRRFA